VVRERDTQRARRLWMSLALVVGALLPAAFYLYEQNTCLQLDYEIASIESQRAELAKAERRLELRRGRIASMQAIERWAARHELTRPSVDDFVVVPYEENGGDTMLARAPEGAPSRAPRAERVE
jgi:hypothetical protein